MPDASDPGRVPIGPLPPALPPSPTPASLEHGERARFRPREMAIVLSHYDLGVLRSVRVFPRGSRRAPKLRIIAERGEFVLKRRAPGRDEPPRVAFAHGVIRRLAAAGYPVADLIALRDGPDGATMVRTGGHAYELFRYVEGHREPGTRASAGAAGDALGRLHRILADHETRQPFRSASFHGAAGVASALRGIPGAVAAAARRAPSRTLAKRCDLLASAYAEAAQRAAETGPADWPIAVIHGDWHPGNLVYRDERIAGVLDFDSARVEPRVMDVANGALQFSMRSAGAGSPETWPDGLDLPRIEALLLGYNRAAAMPLTAGERRALPWLIIEAIIVESVVPIAATGRFGDLDGAAFLEMVERKVRWIAPRAASLAESIDSPPS